MAVDSNKPIAFTFAGLPGGTSYCFTNPQTFAIDITNNLSGYIPGQYSTIIVSESEPAVADRDKLWYKLNSGGAPGGVWYAYYAGQWVSPNPEAADSDAIRIFRGSAADVWSYDGGDGTDPSTNPPTDTTGAMWEIDTDFAARMPLGPGTLPLSGTVVAVGDTGGVDQVTLTEAQIPSHTHPPLSPSTSFVCGGGTLIVGMGSTPAASSAATTGATGGGLPHTTMPPYVSTYFIRRTARIFYTA